MRHVVVVLLLAGLFAAFLYRHVAPDPYTYDEADYMYAASLGFLANYTDTPSMPVSDFLRTGVEGGKSQQSRRQLSEQVRSKGDVLFYRHWHGPLYLDFLIPISRLHLSERVTRTVMLAFPILTLGVLYFACVKLSPEPGPLFAGLLLVSSSVMVYTTEVAPHQLFALLSVVCIGCLAKSIADRDVRYWFAAVIAAGLAFCTLEVAFVLILTLILFAYLEREWLKVRLQSIVVLAGSVLIVWPAAFFKLSVLKSYLFMGYLAIFRESPWGNQSTFEIWRNRIAGSPLEWVAIMASLAIYFGQRENPAKHIGAPFLIFGVSMIAATFRVNSSATRYAVLFTPALDIFAAVTAVPFLLQSSRNAANALLLAGTVLLGLSGYRLWPRMSQDPRPPEILNYIRSHNLEKKLLLLPQEELPMVHYYFPRMRLRGYVSIHPADEDKSTAEVILGRGYPIRFEYPREPPN